MINTELMLTIFIYFLYGAALGRLLFKLCELLDFIEDKIKEYFKKKNASKNEVDEECQQ